MTRAQWTDQEWESIKRYLPIGGFGPYPQRLRSQFEGVLWRFRIGGQWREMPREFGAWSTVSNRFRQWRDAGVFEARECPSNGVTPSASEPFPQAKAPLLVVTGKSSDSPRQQDRDLRQLPADEAVDECAAASRR